MSLIKLPKFFQDKLAEQLNEQPQKQESFRPAVDRNLEQFGKWMQHSHVPFFPDYTDHGPDHITALFDTIDGIITDEARDVMTPADITVLVHAGLLHDCAMHLSEDGFRELVSASNTRVLPHTSDRPWPMLWEEFLLEASRFNDAELEMIFGGREPFDRHKFNLHALTVRDHYLIGEFVRRHHARFAQEVAHWGVPGVKGQAAGERLRFEILDSKLQHLAGLIARSHGMPLRSCLADLKKSYHIRDFKTVHAVYLMVLLRIGDYLQIEAFRAPAVLLKTRSLKSPKSNEEWKKHHAIEDVRRDAHDDPEVLEVTALPQKVEIFLDLAWLFEDIQRELDLSWAVLGEVYGRFDKLRPLGINIRRITSNLDNRGQFSEIIGYVTEEIKFITASAELLSLLVDPLYGSNPSFGIRELVQNAIDAVNERESLDEEQLLIDNEDCHGHVRLSFVTRGTDIIFKIEDNGIGMSLDIIKNYFLRAGASFRSSKEWKNQFLSANDHPKVLRSGRFGVGALAAFLLGDTIKVQTRHRDSVEVKGYRFEASLSSTNISVEPCACPIGTSIEIVLNENAKKLFEVELDRKKQSSTLWWELLDRGGLEWEWYGLAKPRVSCAFDGMEQAIRSRIPSAGSTLPEGWHSFKPLLYDEVQWNYFGATHHWCNGILIYGKGDLGFLSKSLVIDGNYKFDIPQLSVFDTVGAFPLDLSRTSLPHELPFAEDLLDEVLPVCLEYLLTTLKIDSFSRNRRIAEYFDPCFPALELNLKHPDLLRGIYWSPWFSSPLGVSLVDSGVISSLGIREITFFPVILTIDDDEYRPFRRKLRDSQNATNYDRMLRDIPRIHGRNLFGLGWSKSASPFTLLEFILDLDSKMHNRTPFHNIGISGARVLLEADLARSFRDFGQLSKDFFEGIRQLKVDDRWELWEIGSMQSSSEFLLQARAHLYAQQNPLFPGFMAEWNVSPEKSIKPLSKFASVWEKYMGSFILPYEKSLRDALLENLRTNNRMEPGAS